MAYWANLLDPDFCRKINPRMGEGFRAFIGRHFERLVESETPDISPVLARALNLKQNRTGGFTWIPE